MRRPDVADVFVLSVAVAGGVLDARLIRHDRRPITAALRRPVPLGFLTFLTLHAWDLLGPVDPFRAAARMIPKGCPRPQTG